MSTNDALNRFLEVLKRSGKDIELKEDINGALHFSLDVALYRNNMGNIHDLLYYGCVKYVLITKYGNVYTKVTSS